LAIDGALNSKQETRAMMRARSAKQRFPVAQWVEDLEILQSTAIRIHGKEAAKGHHGDRLSSISGFATPTGDRGTMTPTGMSTPPLSHSRNSSFLNINRLSAVGPQSRNTIVYTRDPSPGAFEEKPKTGLNRQLSLGVRSGPGHLAAPERRGRRRARKNTPSAVPESDNENIGQAVTDYEDDSDEDIIPSYYGDDEYTLTPEQAEASRRMELAAQEGAHPPLPPVNRELLSPRKSSFGPPADNGSLHRVPPPYSPGPPSQPGTPGAEDGLLPPARPFAGDTNRLSSASVLSLDSVVGDKKDFNLQKVDPFFTDSTGEFYNAFDKRLDGLNGDNSESQLCIEDYLVRSEKKWFNRFRDARLGRHQSPAPSMFHRKGSRAPSPAGSIFNEDLSGSGSGSDNQKEGSLGDEFLLGKDYVPPTGLKKWMQMRVGDWPVYSFFLGFGQIIAANSYQITLLTGEVGQTATKLYAIASVYLVTSIIWWIMFRNFKSVVTLSLPFFFYGVGFLCIGLAHFAGSQGTRGWIQNVGTGFYAVASSSGSIFFALNFGDEGGAPVKAWVFRACVIQGTQQAYVVALWFWGSRLTKDTQAGIITATPIADTWKMTAICGPIVAILWSFGILMYLGLPDYYRQAPGKVPSFYRSIARRKIILWFFVAVVIQNFFLSAPYGRNWEFLWSSDHASSWMIALLVVLFFIGVWALFLWVFSILSKDHSWILPVFAIGLGAPRWAQIWWGTSNIGQYVPWAGGYTSGALVSRALWLWLGVLDAMQGVGFGMILLQTLTRVHIAFTLLTAQVLGSIATICARAFSPNKIGPGPIHPDISGGISPLWTPWFFIALSFNLLIW
ncbi:Cell wall alpha-1,3-glucan synthase ags1, partial [Mycoblastus sanguinarius]|nr:Cell wall alpha-1,3-glucan synthase ags1 [Mycoblastus sanguinarius]